jgi:hypothetical protein
VSTVSSVPEPNAALLLGASVVILIGIKRRNKPA